MRTRNPSHREAVNLRFRAHRTGMGQHTDLELRFNLCPEVTRPLNRTEITDERIN